MADALTTSRDAIVGPVLANTARNLPLQPVDHIGPLEKWAPDFRLHTCFFEAVSPLRGEAFSAADEFKISHLQPKPGVPGNFEAVPIFSLVRPTKDQFKDQLPLVLNWAELRSDRFAEILVQVTNAAPFWASIMNLQPQRQKYTIELLSLVDSFATCVEMRFKHAMACHRPAHFSSQVQPIIATPGHSSYPSGHATAAFLTAHVAEQLVGPAYEPNARAELKAQLQRLAARIAINRTVAGVHFPVDSAAGRALGQALGGYLVHRFKGTGNFDELQFDGSKFHNANAPIDFNHNVQPGNLPYYTLTAARTLNAASQSGVLKKLWALAQAEW
jgi:membrane-associated phospholipid phosphatase